MLTNEGQKQVNSKLLKALKAASKILHISTSGKIHYVFEYHVTTMPNAEFSTMSLTKYLSLPTTLSLSLFP